MSRRRALLDSVRRAVTSSTSEAAHEPPGEVDAEAALAAAARSAERGQWADAAARLTGLLEVAPEDARGHRELARVATAMAVWQGSLRAAGPAHEGALRFATLRDLDTDEMPEAVRDPVAAGRRAMERAVELHPRSVAWLAPLAELRGLDGDLAGAIDAYERAVDASTTSHSAWVLKSRHLWQFELERARHRRGEPRVTDPLFEAALLPVPTDDAEVGAVGAYRARFTHQGLHISGMVLDPQVDTVTVALDGTVVRRINLGGGELPRTFDTVLRRPVLDVAPTRSRLTVASIDGRRLHTHGTADAVDVQLPTATGRLGQLLASGVTVDKKGGLSPTADEVAERQERLLQLYRSAREVFAAEFGRDLFVLYGTLLGIHRQGALIPGDDDLDCGYVAAGEEPQAVKAEAVAFIESLVRAGFSVSVNRRGRLFRLHHDAVGDATVHLDVHPVWFEGPDLYVHNHHRFPAAVDDLLPAVERDLRGGTVLVPRHPEVLLERFYGPDWRTPDPGYVDDATGTETEVMARLSEALLTPDEFRDLERRVDASSDARRGRLVSIAAQSLYPLDDFVE